MKPAVFLDRDGVLTVEKGYLRSADDMVIYDYARDCIKRLQDAGFLTIVITNQSGVARGYFSEDELIDMNDRLIRETKVDDIYYCPHHPEGKIEAYRKVCSCRKPGTGMVDKACADHSIDLSCSYLIGDRGSDILTGQNAGIKTILVRSGYGSSEEKKLHPDHVCDDLRDAVNVIVQSRS
ncbi:MAG: HAD family hydrolase [Lachnospiraceae bacterium]|nr:HAD family hydrolase [Lachnospiraceae bacterium]